MANAIDILVWPDGFWCFRKELKATMQRDDNYRVIYFDSEEWFVMARQWVHRSSPSNPRT